MSGDLDKEAKLAAAKKKYADKKKKSAGKKNKQTEGKEEKQKNAETQEQPEIKADVDEPASPSESQEVKDELKLDSKDPKDESGNDIEELMAELSKLNTELRQRDETITELKSNVQQNSLASKSLQEKENDFNALSLERSKLRNELDAAKKEIEDLKHSRSEESNTSHVQPTDNPDMLAELDRVKQELSEERSSRHDTETEMKSVISGYEAKHVSMQNAQAQSHVRLQELISRSSALQNENKDLLGQLSEMRTKVIQLTEEKLRISDDFEKTQKDLNEVRSSGQNHDDGEDVQYILESRIRELESALHDAHHDIFEYQKAALSQGDDSRAPATMEDIPLSPNGHGEPPHHIQMRFETINDVRIDLMQIGCAGLVGEPIYV